MKHYDAIVIGFGKGGKTLTGAMPGSTQSKAPMGSRSLSSALEASSSS